MCLILLGHDCCHTSRLWGIIFELMCSNETFQQRLHFLALEREWSGMKPGAKRYRSRKISQLNSSRWKCCLTNNNANRGKRSRWIQQMNSRDKYVNGPGVLDTTTPVLESCGKQSNKEQRKQKPASQAEVSKTVGQHGSCQGKEMKKLSQPNPAESVLQAHTSSKSRWITLP